MGDERKPVVLPVSFRVMAKIYRRRALLLAKQILEKNEADSNERP